MMKTLRFISLMISIFAVVSCQKTAVLDSNIPTVTTLDAESIGSTTATIGGKVSDLHTIHCEISLSYSTDRNFPKEHTSTQSYGYANPETEMYINAELTGLLSGTTYYYICSASDGIAEVKGAVKTFTTAQKNEIIGRYRVVVWTFKRDNASSPFTAYDNSIGVTVEKYEDRTDMYLLKFDEIFPEMIGEMKGKNYLRVDSELNGFHDYLNPVEKEGITYGWRLCCSFIHSENEVYWARLAGENSENWDIYLTDDNRLGAIDPHAILYYGYCHGLNDCELGSNQYHVIPKGTSFYYITE